MYNLDGLLVGGDGNKPYVKRQNSYIPDESVKRIARSAMVINNQFRKIVFEDGSSTIAPKGYIPSSTIKNNGCKTLGLNTVFTPKPGTENGGFILNTNHIDTGIGTTHR